MLVRKNVTKRALSLLIQSRRTFHSSHSSSKQVSTNEGEVFEKEGGQINATTTAARFQPSLPIEDSSHPLASQRKHRLIFKSDREILENSQYPAEFPSTHIPVPEPEIPHSRGRQALAYLYDQFRELYNRHRTFVWFNYVNPRKQIGTGAWVAPSATIIGNVWIGSGASVWYNAVLRADKNEIEIGAFTNIQDGVIITVDDVENQSGFNSEVTIGEYTTVGHGAILHGCNIGNRCIIGMNATILEGAVIEDDAIVAAGSVVPAGRRIPSGEVWGGKPARFIRALGKNEKVAIQQSATNYIELSKMHALEWTTTGTAHKYVEKLTEEVESHLPNLDDRPVHWKTWERMNDGSGLAFWKRDREF